MRRLSRFMEQPGQAAHWPDKHCKGRICAMRALWITLMAAGALAVSGCSTVRGAGIGAAVGAGAAAVTDNSVKDGALIGAGTGAVVGTVAD